MFRKISIVAALTALLVTVLIPVAVAVAPKVSATLTGKAEVPGPGDPNGKGDILITVKKAKSKVCFVLEIDKIEPPTSGHIHKGGADVAGPVKITLFTDPAGLPVPGSFESRCVKGPEKVIKGLAKNPAKFYVNLHNDEFPDGAIRGQLAPAPPGE